jgi:cold shock CspA family protein
VLKSFKRFHYDNNIWFERNIARSKAELGELEIAITKLKSLLERKNEWYIQKEIAELLKRQGKIDESLAFAIDAALNRGEPDFKINLYTLLSELLKEKAKINEAKTHVELIYQIKVAKQWRIDDDFNKLVLDYKIETRNLPSSKELLWKLKQIWESMKYDNQELLKGKIKNIISDGKAGFICADNRREYFFFANAFNGKKELLHQGQRVSFYLEDSYDKKKNQPSKIAVYIKPIM